MVDPSTDVYYFSGCSVTGSVISAYPAAEYKQVIFDLEQEPVGDYSVSLNLYTDCMPGERVNVNLQLTPEGGIYAGLSFGRTSVNAVINGSMLASAGISNGSEHVINISFVDSLNFYNIIITVDQILLFSGEISGDLPYYAYLNVFAFNNASVFSILESTIIEEDIEEEEETEPETPDQESETGEETEGGDEGMEVIPEDNAGGEEEEDIDIEIPEDVSEDTEEDGGEETAGGITDDADVVEDNSQMEGNNEDGVEESEDLSAETSGSIDSAEESENPLTGGWSNYAMGTLACGLTMALLGITLKKKSID